MSSYITTGKTMTIFIKIFVVFYCKGILGLKTANMNMNNMIEYMITSYPKNMALKF